MTTKRKRLGEMLVDASLITEAQLRGALGRQKKWGGRLGANLIKLGNISEQDLLRFLANQTGIKEMDISSISILPHIIKLVPEKVAQKYTVVPVAMKGPHTLMVACADPTDLAALDHISFVTGHKVEPILATHSQILAAIDRYYRGGRGQVPQQITRHSDDEDLTVELTAGSETETDGDPDLIIFDKRTEHAKPPKAPERKAGHEKSRRFGPPPNMPDPFYPSNAAQTPVEDDEFTLDFTPDWAAPASRAKPGAAGQQEARQQAATSVKTQPARRPNTQFTLEQKMRALYNVMIRKGLVKEAEIQQELMRLWTMGKL